MDPEAVQIGLEGARNLEQPHGGFNFSNSRLMHYEAGPVCALNELAFEISQSAVPFVDTTNVQPSVKGTREPNDGDQRRDDRYDKEHDSIEQ
jgi:hypothetical protein